jgi:SHS2 domain-containing protein
MERYRTFDHTADLGLEIYGRDEKELFSNAAFALFDTMTDIGNIALGEKRTVRTEGADREDLLVNFMREILSLYHIEGFLTGRFALSELNEHSLSGEAEGETFDPKKHGINTEIKAVTYHQVEIAPTSDGFMGRLICDV